MPRLHGQKLWTVWCRYVVLREVCPLDGTEVERSTYLDP